MCEQYVDKVKDKVNDYGNHLILLFLCYQVINVPDVFRSDLMHFLGLLNPFEFFPVTEQLI